MNERNTFNMITLELFIFQLTFILQIKNTFVRDECSSSICPVESKAWLYIRRDYARAFCHLLSND